jgi:signal transduction histidine kinase
VSDRLKTAFLANMSHEIRTPLNGVVGFADLLKSSDITANDWKSYLDIIVSSGQQLLCIINDVLAISKIETGQEHVEIQQIFLPVVFEEIQLFFQSMAADTHNDLVLKLPDDETSRYVMSDGGKIRQILTNLVNNALKFTRNGIVTFGYTRELQQVLFFVKDTGIGIPSTHISIIFDRFVQVENAAGGVEHPGTGLGLSICKKMVELMGGKIWVESKLNEGSVFYFALPL